MQSKDVFSGLSWGNLERYKIRNEQTICKEKAAQLDKQILQIAAGVPDYDWAIKALDFCTKEAVVGKNVLQYSKEAFRLPELQSKAQNLIKQEKDRIAAESRAKAAAMDESIKALVVATRTKYWYQEVRNLDGDIRKLPREVRVLITRLNQLEKMVEECDLMRASEEAEDKVRKLISANPKNDAWLRTVERYVKAKPGDSLLKPIRDQELLKNLVAEYWRVYHAPVVAQYADVLNQVEKGKWAQGTVRASFHNRDEELKKLRFKMEEYVPGFDARWKIAREQVAAEEKRLEEVKKEEARQAQMAEERKDLQKYLDCLKQVEAGKADQEQLRIQFRSLDKQLSTIKYNPTNYQEDFRTRWAAAKSAVDAAQKKADDEVAAAKRAAREKEDRDDLKKYLNCLENIERNGADRKQYRDQYTQLDTQVRKLRYDPNSYVPDFKARWKAAGIKVTEAEKAEQAAAERRRREEEEQERRVQAAVMESLAKCERKAYIGQYFGFMGSIILSVALAFVGGYFASGYSAWWYTPVMIALAGTTYTRMHKLDEDNLHEYRHVLAQILFYGVCFVIPAYFEKSIFVMIVSGILTALVFNLQPYLVHYEIDNGPAAIKTICAVACGAILLLGLEILMPQLLSVSVWHMLWYAPVLVMAASLSLSYAVSVKGADAGPLAIIEGLALDIALFIRMVVIMIENNGFDFGMGIVAGLMLVVTAVGALFASGILAAIEDID